MDAKLNDYGPSDVHNEGGTEHSDELRLGRPRGEKPRTV